MINTVDDSNGRDWQSRTKNADEVRQKLRGGWKHDPAILNQYFESCYTNWKVYKGDRTPKQVLKLQAIYKQAVYGDNPDAAPENLDTTEGHKWQAWNKLKGMPQEMAKRRFITFLAEINPALIDVMPDEKPPPGFPLDRRGNPICAKCNTVVGCARPLLDQFKMNLRTQLFENEEFHEPEKLTLWIQNAIANQRCVWGMHQAITKAEARPFMDWFNREENRGFYPYDSIILMKIVRELVFNYHEVVYDLMQRKQEILAEVYNAQARRTMKLKEIFETFSGEEFVFELPCTRDADVCNQRRIADGGRNHKHEVILDPPTHSDLNTMEEAIQLRKQCQKLGLNPCTGVVKNTSERCEIYRNRIAEHFAALKKAAEAKARNDLRVTKHKEEKKKVVALSKDIMERQCWDACNRSLVEQVRVLIKRGCNPNEESSRGLTPLLTMLLNEVATEKIEELLPFKIDVNHVNRFGMTPLMLACRLKDMKMVHVLMKNGASALHKGENGRTALHTCVIHGNDEAAKVIAEYLKDGAGDSMRVIRFIDAIDDDGESALITACRIRNGLFCHLLTSMGANPNNRNSVGRTAAYVARSKNWNEVADWLEKKVGAGVKVETYSDQQFEKQCKLGMIKTRESLQNFGKSYLLLIQHRLGIHPLGCPLKTQIMIEEHGDNSLFEQQFFVDNHQKYIMQNIPKDYMITSQQQSNASMALKRKMGLLKLKEIDDETAATYLKQLKDMLNDIVATVRQGYTYPNQEILPQPLPWTPLMCAVAINDVRSAKLLMREGANPNHPNKDGTTPLMLAAQLQETEMLVELLAGGGDLLAVDNQGYAALAYASSLPLPTVMNREVKDVMTNDAIYGPKLLSTQKIIEKILNENPVEMNGGESSNNQSTKEEKKDKSNHNQGIVKVTAATDRNRTLVINIDELKAMIKKNYEEVSGDTVEKYMKQNKLLENYGLTPIDNEHNLLHQVKSSQWRVGDVLEDEDGEDGRKRRKIEEEDEEEDSVLREIEEEMKKQYEDIQEAKRKEKERLEALEKGTLRCPICTLAIPCAHFLKIQSLMSFLNEQQGIKPEGASPFATIKHLSSFKVTRKLKVKNRAQDILDEAHIGDRRTDRSKTLAENYQAKELELEKNWKARIDKEMEDQTLALEEAKEKTEEAAEELLDYHPLDPHNRTRNFQTDSSSVLALPAGPSSSEKSDLDDNKAILPVEEKDSIESFSTSEKALVIVPVPILKPPSREATTAGASRKSKRVKFDLPGLDEDEPLLAITDGSELLEEQEKPKPSDAEQALMVLQAGEDVSFANKKSLYASNGKRRVMLITREAMGKSHDGFTSIDVTSYVKLAPKAPPPSYATSRPPKVPAPPTLPPSSSKANMVPNENLRRPQPQNFAEINDPMEVVKEIMRSIPPNQSGKRIPRKNNVIPTKVKTNLSGWIFVHLGKLNENIIPLETITISQDAWIKISDHISNKFESEWYESSELQVLIDMKSWQIKAPRCLLCGLGIVRNRQSLQQYRENEDRYHWEANNLMQQLTTYYHSLHSSGSNGRGEGEEERFKDLEHISQTYEELVEVLEPHLCLQCVIRKELYQKIQQSMPRSMRQSLAMRWPFLPLPEHQPKRRALQSPLDFPSLTSPLSPTSQSSSFSREYQRQSSFPAIRDQQLQGTDATPLVTVTDSPPSSPLRPPNLMIKTSNSALDLLINSSSSSNPQLSSGPLSFESTTNPPSEISLVSETSSQLFSPGIPYKKLPYHQSSRSPHARSSPLASQKLQYLDDVEAQILTYQDPNQFAKEAIEWLDQNDVDNSDNLSQGSVQSSISNLTMGSANTLPTVNTGTSATSSLHDTISTLSKVDPIKRPKELTLLPYLIARGHYEETERTIRILLSKPAVDEGEGVFLLLKILSYQADMYKSMGLYPLALSLYLDITDITASLLGMSDYVTFRAAGLVMLCYHKMLKSSYADDYLQTTTRTILMALRSEQKEQMVERLHGLKRKINQDYLRLNSVWKEYIHPFLEKYSNRSIQRRYYEILGIGGFYSFLTSMTSVLVVSRRVFFTFCQSAECPYPEIVPLFSHFLDYCFRMHTTDEEEVYRFLVQYIIQKCLAKSLVNTSPLARLFREKTSKTKIEQIISFIRQGQSLDIRVFDEIIYYTLQLLASSYRYFLFHSIMGQVIMQEHYIDLLAEGMDIAATLIQCQFRKRKSMIRVKELLKVKREREEEERIEEMKRKEAKEKEELLKIEKLRAQATVGMIGSAPNSSGSSRNSQSRRSILF